MSPLNAYRKWFQPLTLKPEHIRTANIRNWLTIFAAIPMTVLVNSFLEEGFGKLLLSNGILLLQILCIMRISRLGAISEALNPVVSVLAAMDEPGNIKAAVAHAETGEELTEDETIAMTGKDIANIAFKAGHSAIVSTFTALLRTFHEDTSCTQCRGRDAEHDESADEPEPEEHA